MIYTQDKSFKINLKHVFSILYSFHFPLDYVKNVILYIFSNISILNCN